MAHRISYKITKEEFEAVYAFSKQINLPLDFIAKQALFMAVQAAYRKATNLQQQQQADQPATEAAISVFDSQPVETSHVQGAELDNSQTSNPDQADSSHSDAPPSQT